MSETLDLREREKLTDVLHRGIGFYISEDTEAALVLAVECMIEARMAAVSDVADGWQAEAEDSVAEVIIGAEEAASKVRAALAKAPR